MTGWWVATRLALVAVIRAGVRSALTTLGILIGIAAVVVVTALGEGAREQIGGRIESLGSNVIYVFNQPVTKSGARGDSRGFVGVGEGDAAAIREGASAVSAVTVYSSTDRQVATSEGNARTSLVGTDRDYLDVRGYTVTSGRNWSEAEEKTRAKVCLIGDVARRNLFGTLDPIGRFVRVGQHPFKVIGTLSAKGATPFGGEQDDRLLIPIGTWRTRVQPWPGDRVHIIMASARTAAVTSQAERQIEAILRQTHRIPESGESDFRVRSQSEFKKTQDRIVGILTVLLLSVAAIALFVGGVGVMNIMLVSVAERKREIGIRIAIGAKPRDIQRQFLAEALMLTSFGGACGLLLAFAVVALLERGAGWSMAVSPAAVFVAIATSLVVGFIFGYLPARRAAALEPMEALRHE